MLNKPIINMPGVGAKTAERLENLKIFKISDLLWHLPTNMIDRRQRTTIHDAVIDEVNTIVVTIVSNTKPYNKRSPHKVVVKDDTGVMTISFFSRSEYLTSSLVIGGEYIISGNVSLYGDKKQMSHPDYLLPVSEAHKMVEVEPIHKLTDGIKAPLMRKLTAQAVSMVEERSEWISDKMMAERGWPTFIDALKSAHLPQHRDDLKSSAPARQRLAYDEILASQLRLAMDRNNSGDGRIIKSTGKIFENIIEVLPFKLTTDQSLTVEADIEWDMTHEPPMRRLIQGDVGSGKTIVALLAMALAVESGAQAAIMAPTGILAQQHYEEMVKYSCGMRVELLTGRVKGKKRIDILERLVAGEIDILVGTHALIQEDVVFKDLALCVTDEQHRFGVEQVEALVNKGNKADALYMTATPIPRTLTLTAYGNMDISRIMQKPAGRLPIDTRIVSLNDVEAVLAGLNRAVASGAKAYWVCPLVEETEGSELMDAEYRLEILKESFGDRVDLVHGKMKEDDKEAVMRRFMDGELDVLVATTVIEVGVNNPDATIMIVEHSERFGVSQLHQLRGRVGRGSKASTCILLHDHDIGEIGTLRMKILRDSEDGFVLSEEDLLLRGAGELMGTRQSGLPPWRIADLVDHADLIEIGNEDAKNRAWVIAFNGDVIGEALGSLLEIFGNVD